MSNDDPKQLEAKAFKAGLRLLAELDHRCLAFCLLHHLKFADIARLLRISENEVRARLDRARQQLKSQLPGTRLAPQLSDRDLDVILRPLLAGPPPDPDGDPQHLAPGQAADWLAGVMPPEHQTAVGRHLEVCSRCLNEALADMERPFVKGRE